MRLDKLIPEFKVAVDAGTLSLVAAVDLSYLSDEEQKLICSACELAGRKIQAKQAAGFRKLAGKITKEKAEAEFGQEPKKQKAMVSVKISAETFRRYFSDTAAADVPGVLEKALEQYFRERTEMFHKEDLQCLDPDYFAIIHVDDYDITVMSKNTGMCGISIIPSNHHRKTS